MGCTASSDLHNHNSRAAQPSPATPSTAAAEQAAATYVLDPAVVDSNTIVVALIDHGLRQQLAAFDNGSFSVASNDNHATNAMPLVALYDESALAAAAAAGAATEQRGRRELPPELFASVTSASSRRRGHHSLPCANPLFGIDAVFGLDESPVAADIFGADILSPDGTVCTAAVATPRRSQSLSHAAQVLRFSPSSLRTVDSGSIGTLTAASSTTLPVHRIDGGDVEVLQSPTPPAGRGTAAVVNPREPPFRSVCNAPH